MLQGLLWPLRPSPAPETHLRGVARAALAHPPHQGLQGPWAEQQARPSWWPHVGPALPRAARPWRAGRALAEQPPSRGNRGNRESRRTPGTRSQPPSQPLLPTHLAPPSPALGAAAGPALPSGPLAGGGRTETVQAPQASRGSPPRPLAPKAGVCVAPGGRCSEAWAPPSASRAMRGPSDVLSFPMEARGTCPLGVREGPWGEGH